jgi:hypothetical protein
VGWRVWWTRGLYSWVDVAIGHHGEHQQLTGECGEECVEASNKIAGIQISEQSGENANDLKKNDF